MTNYLKFTRGGSRRAKTTIIYPLAPSKKVMERLKEQRRFIHRPGVVRDVSTTLQGRGWLEMLAQHDRGEEWLERLAQHYRGEDG